MILLIDNFDSFAHNLARYLQRLGQQVCVVRNDAIVASEIRQMRPAAIVLSPGPCAPRQAGASLDIVRSLHAEIPMLGVCLGHQVIAEALGGQIVRAKKPVHGQYTAIRHNGCGLFKGLSSPLRVARYHSLVADPNSLPQQLQPAAWTDDGIVMSFKHKSYPVFGVQFHPESVLTEGGYEILTNFLCAAGETVEADPRQLLASELPNPRGVERLLPDQPVTF
jgi:anthranilate synthase/aminodeoxychorismate synthase-like glutamine amidotransferase